MVPGAKHLMEIKMIKTKYIYIKHFGLKIIKNINYIVSIRSILHVVNIFVLELYLVYYT